MSIRDMLFGPKPHPMANTWGIKLERNDMGRGDQYRFVHVAWDEDGNRTETILRPADNPHDPKETWL